MAQFTAIKGRKIPNDEYKVGANFSTIISTSCVNAAMTAMNMMKLRKLRSTPFINASGARTYLFRR